MLSKRFSLDENNQKLNCIGIVVTNFEKYDLIHDKNIRKHENEALSKCRFKQSLSSFLCHQETRV
jgi:hypothetical protein